MNLSISQLQLSQIASLSPILALNGPLSTQECQISRQFSTFLYSTSTSVVSRSIFTSFLNTAFMYNSATNKTRVTSFSSNISFNRCVFTSMSGNTHGGAIFSTSSYSLSLTFCVFSSCTSVLEGGAIYATSCPLSIIYTCFNLCYVTTSQNDIWGNAVYSLGSPFVFTKSYSIYCGPSLALAGDSTVLTSKSLCTIKYNNASKNLGNTGSIDVNIQYPTSGSVYSFNSIINTVGVGDGVEFWSSNSLSISTFNAFNLTNLNSWGVMFINSGSITVTEAIILECTNSIAACLYNSSSVTYVDCISDGSFSGYTYASSAATYDIGNVYSRGCQVLESFQFSNTEQNDLGKVYGSVLIFSIIMNLW